jgi:hypothetical protein
MSTRDALAETIVLIDEVETPEITMAEKLCDIAPTGARADAFGTPTQLYETLASVGSDVAASSADFRHRDQQAEVYGMLRTWLDGLKARFAQFVSGDLAASWRRSPRRWRSRGWMCR